MDLSQSRLDELSAFSLRLGAADFMHWSEIEMVSSIDAFTSVGFRAPFEPSRSELREAFRPLSYRPVSVLLGKHQLQFTGRMVCVEAELTSDRREVVVQANSLPSVLADCTAPAKTTNGRQFNGLKLEDIANELCTPLGFNARFADERSTFIDTNGDGELERDRSSSRAQQKRIEDSFAAAFPRVRLEPNQKVFEFLTKLAKQRGVLITDSPTGDLVFQRATYTGRPVAHFEEGVAPLVAIKPNFNPSEYYSHVTAIVSKKRGQKAGRFTVRNPFLADDGITRPHSFDATDCQVGSGPQIAADFMSRMFGNAVSWEIELPTFVDPQGEYFRPNTTITVRAPSAMIYQKSELLIREVTKRQTADSTSCTLVVCLPSAFSGIMPATLPWLEAQP